MRNTLHRLTYENETHLYPNCFAELLTLLLPFYVFMNTFYTDISSYGNQVAPTLSYL